MSVHLPKFTVEAEFTKQEVQAAAQRLHPKGISASAFQRAWNAGFTGKGINVAVLDTGIDRSHPDLRGKVTKLINLTGDALTESHGTHVAGTIAANGWLLGGAPGASLFDVKVLSPSGGSIANVAKGISLSALNGASVINLSLGTSALGSLDIQRLANAISDAWNRGAICIAASGNDGISVCTPDPFSYPASIQRAESIGACEVGENLNTITLTTFSNENTQVDLAACGQNVVSTVIGGGYAIYNGTSMATPHVSAMAAVLAEFIRSRNPTLKGASFSAALVSLLHSHVLPIQNCGTASIVTFKDKTLVKYIVTDHCIKSNDDKPNDVKPNDTGPNVINPAATNISFGLGFIRYEPANGPVVPSGQKFYHGGIFLGHLVTV